MNIARMEKFEQLWSVRHDLPAESLAQYRFESREGYRLPELAAHYRTHCDALEDDLDRKNLQAECLKRGFEYVRESDDHYVLADLPEMADLLGMLLGVEVRTKDNDAYEEANSRLNEQIEGLISTIHAQESLRKDAERYRKIRQGSIHDENDAGIYILDQRGEKYQECASLIRDDDLDAAIDAAMSAAQ